MVMWRGGAGIVRESTPARLQHIEVSFYTP